MRISFLLLFIFLSRSVSGQKVINYYFEENFKELTSQSLPLKTVNEKGYFQKEVITKFGEKPRNVYVFPQSSGLLFDNPSLDNFIIGSFALEIYFRYDNSNLLIYDQMLGEELEANQGKYVHLVVTRDDRTKRVIVYLQGNKSLDFFDSNDEMAMDNESQINFFVQDGVQTTSGAVAMLKIYNYFIDETMGEDLFESFSTKNNAEALEIRKGEGATLNRLYFLKTLAKILPESNPELERLSDYMVKNKEAKIEIQGHTDNQGDYNLNIKLSRERAQIIKIFLVEQGISAKRIKIKGYGGTKPVASNYSEYTRRLNRRVEVVLL
ncbi:MAG: OOP family OmpA-OmpF porin [Algoriphagus sp.]|jgi:OOP family OmpA-OmpF porin